MAFILYPGRAPFAFFIWRFHLAQVYYSLSLFLKYALALGMVNFFFFFCFYHFPLVSFGLRTQYIRWPAFLPGDGVL